AMVSGSGTSETLQTLARTTPAISAPCAVTAIGRSLRLRLESCGRDAASEVSNMGTLLSFPTDHGSGKRVPSIAPGGGGSREQGLPCAPPTAPAPFGGAAQKPPPSP